MLLLEESNFNDSHAELVERDDPVPVWPNRMPSWRADADGGVTGLSTVDAPRIPADAGPSLWVPIPLEYFEERRDDLYGMWRAGAGQFDLARRLSANSADRTCETCGDPALFYLFTDHGVSTFRCDDHIPAGTDPEGNIGG